MSPLTPLIRAAYGLHIADQIALVSVPLVAALVFDAPAPVIGALIACQSMAHLLGSVPFGILVDTVQLRRLAMIAAGISLIGFGAAALGVASGSLIGFGCAITFSGFGIVLYTLTALSAVPRITDIQHLAPANARLELPRAMASLAVPLSIGLVVSDFTAGWLFPTAAACAAFACVITWRLPPIAPAPRSAAGGILRRISEGGVFVWRHPLLRAILFCALFWNFAFSALLVSMVPLIEDVYLMAPGTFGIALAAFGAGAVLGSWISTRMGTRIAPQVVLLFGPGVSILAPLILINIGATHSPLLIYLAFLIIGFGPSMWLIAQNAVRQRVSPPQVLGRVNAVIQTAIYGVRPLAALISGAVVGATSPKVGLALVLAGFTLSFLAAALSGLRHVKSYSALRATP